MDYLRVQPYFTFSFKKSCFLGQSPRSHRRLSSTQHFQSQLCFVSVIFANYFEFYVTVCVRIGNYWTPVDQTLILGCAPMGFMGHPKQLHQLGVRGVINMCYEYPGPKAHYLDLGIKQLRLPTVDHFEPKPEYYEEAVKFIQQFKEKGEKVYVHCKAGHGRAASVAFAWLLHENPKQSPLELNVMLSKKRRVRKTLYKQKNILTYISRIRDTKK